MAFSCFYKGGWDVYLMKEIFPPLAKGEELGPTPFQKGETFAVGVLAVPESDTAAIDSLSQAEHNGKSGFTSYVFRSKEEEDFAKQDTLPDSLRTRPRSEKDTLAYLDQDGEFKRHRYGLKFTPDLVAGAFGYDPFFGFIGQSFLAFSDIMGDHNFLVATDIYTGALDQINFQGYYSYTAKRTDYSTGILHTKYYYIDDKNRLFSDRVYGGLVGVSRPFSKFMRLDLSASHIGIDRKYELDDEFLANPVPVKDSRKIDYLDLSLVKDNILWGLTGPINGNRYKFTFEWAPQVAKSGIAFRSLWGDYRRYFHFLRRFNLAFRVAGGSSWGQEPRTFFLGGISNWISPDYIDTDIYSVENLYFSGIITPLRGYDYFEFSGRNFGLFNFEFRYPFIKQLAFDFPLSLTLSRVTGIMFFDAGAAWNEHDHFKGGNGSGEDRLQDIHSAFGFGTRANLGFLILRFDTAWATDFASVNKPRYYFSLGADF